MKKKILVVDDSRDILILTQTLLSKQGYEVIPLSDGQRTLEVLQKESVDLVILDNLLEETTGGEICHQIKTDPALAHIPVIITTGDVNSDESQISAGLHKPNEYLIKPFELEDLLEKVAKLLA